MEDNRKLVLEIDFYNMVFGSYHSKPLINQLGQNVNAIIGFFNKLKFMKETFNPDYIVAASDMSRNTTFRRKIYPPYKAQRKPKDENIMWQCRIIKQMFGLLGFQVIENSFYEADDLLGMMAKYNHEHNMKTIIVSGDRDLYQLVDDDVFLVSPVSGAFVDREYIRKYYDLTPEQWIDLKILKGDPSDNIKGVEGIGDKTAMKLMHTYGSLNKIYDSLINIHPPIAKRLERAIPNLQLIRELVTIITDYTRINYDMKMILRREPFVKELFDVISYIGAPSLAEPMRQCLLPQKDDKIGVYDNAYNKIN